MNYILNIFKDKHFFPHIFYYRKIIKHLNDKDLFVLYQ